MVKKKKKKNLPAKWETWDHSLGQEDSLEKGMGTHSTILAWAFPWTGKPGGLLPGAVMGGPARDEVMKKIPGRQGRPGPHP